MVTMNAWGDDDLGTWLAEYVGPYPLPIEVYGLLLDDMGPGIPQCHAGSNAWLIERQNGRRAFDDPDCKPPGPGDAP